MIFILWTGISFTAGKKEFRLDVTDVRLAVGWRSDLWEDSLRMVLDRPNFGYGPNTFMPTFFDFGRVIRGVNHYSMPTYAHNCFIQLAAEMGLWGLGSFVWILGSLFQKVIGQLSREAGDYNLKLFSAGMLGGTVAFLGHSFVDTNLFSLQLSALFWLMIGLQAAVYHIQIANSKLQTIPKSQ